jgi:hypothetical protein
VDDGQLQGYVNDQSLQTPAKGQLIDDWFINWLVWDGRWCRWWMAWALHVHVLSDLVAWMSVV